MDLPQPSRADQCPGLQHIYSGSLDLPPLQNTEETYTCWLPSPPWKWLQCTVYSWGVRTFSPPPKMYLLFLKSFMIYSLLWGSSFQQVLKRPVKSLAAFVVWCLYSRASQFANTKATMHRKPTPKTWGSSLRALLIREPGTVGNLKLSCRTGLSDSKQCCPGPKSTSRFPPAFHQLLHF